MAEQNKILERIKESKIIAIVRGIPSSSIVDLVEAMVKGGVSCVEVTFGPEQRGEIQRFSEGNLPDS